MSQFKMKMAGRDTDEGNLLVLAVLASVIGLGAGLIGGLFRLSLQWADTERNALIAWAHGQSVLGFAVIVGGWRRPPVSLHFWCDGLCRPQRAAVSRISRAC
jgi:hypothetical protein